MQGKHFKGLFLAFAAATVVIAGWKAAGAEGEKKPTAKEILKKCDDFHFGFKDSSYKIDVTLIDKDGKKSFMKLENYQKGSDKRLLRFTEPKDIAGLAILNKDANTMYVYEPSLGKVRKIATHAKKQTMLGLDFTLDEASTFRYDSDYDPKLIGEDEGGYKLFLTQKSGRDKAWPVVKITVDKKKWFASKIEYCDAKEKMHKTEVRSNVKQLSGRWVTARMTMTDHGKKHTTIYDMADAKFNTGLSDELFTKRNLVREE
jgi:outer membrane lipoprotein-sorting protein